MSTRLESRMRKSLGGARLGRRGKAAVDAEHRSRTSVAAQCTLQRAIISMNMEGWHKIQSSIGSINFGQAGNKLAKGFNSSVQATRERLGQVAADEITELPQGALSRATLWLGGWF